MNSIGAYFTWIAVRIEIKWKKMIIVRLATAKVFTDPLV